MNNNLMSDIHDSEKDKAKLKPEETVLDLPEVKDIPGQEFIHAPDLREMADTTIASDDEEGVGVFGDDDENNTSERLAIGEELNENDLLFNETEEPVPGDDDIEITNSESDNEDADVTEEEKEVLARTENMDSQDNENLYRAELDNTDDDGEKLNENEDFSGDDLDVPGEDDDDADEEIGEEDEENNSYSLGDNK